MQFGVLHTFRRAVCAAIIFAAAGCASYEHRVHLQPPVLTPELAGQIGSPNATPAWLQAHLGPPTEIITDSEYREYWVYEHAAGVDHQAKIAPVMSFRWTNSENVRDVFVLQSGRFVQHLRTVTDG